MQSRITALISRSSQQFSAGMDEDAQRCAVISRDSACQQYVLNAMQHYAKALALDSKHVYLALPRLLSLWFEFTAMTGKEGDLDSNTSNRAVKAEDLIRTY
jgi:serine/threonine-protein kinase ATR